MRKIILVFSFFLLVHCVDRTIPMFTETEGKALVAFQHLASSSKLFIANDDEPGEKLMLCLTFVDIASKRSLPDRSVHFYHASTDGEYEPSDPTDETTARLNGSAMTDANGKVFVETILPGDYGSSANNRHIHTSVRGAKPEAYDIFFKQYSSGVGTFLDSGNYQMFYADLRRTSDNILICFLTIEVRDQVTKE